MGQDMESERDKIWKVKAAERIRNFLWLAAHDSLMSNANRTRRHMGTDSNCGHCHNICETTLHILRDCPVASSLWQELLTEEELQQFQEGDVKAWIGRNVSKPGIWPTIFCYGVWWLWRWRNAKVFNSGLYVPTARHTFVLDRGHEYLDLWEGRSMGSLNIPSEIATWSRPIVGWVKLNTDESYRAGSDQLCDHARKFIKAFICKAAGNSALRSELLGVLHGLSVAWQLGVKYLVAELDSLEVIKTILSSDVQAVTHRVMLTEINKLLSRPEWRVVVDHVSRIANHSADWLARYARWGIGEFTLPDYPPYELLSFLEKDRVASDII